jgi:ribosome-associated heat shock protein Hsp15
LVKGGHPRINSHPLTSLHADVSPGDVVTIAIADQVRVITVIALPLRRGPASEAQTFYHEPTRERLTRAEAESNHSSSILGE